jgi:hypothetical protein
MTKKNKFIAFKSWSIFLILMMILFIWRSQNYPRSWAEFKFIQNLQSINIEKNNEILISNLMPNDWETVCESHGYDGTLYVGKYNKTFPTAGAMQDGSWGLVFIQKNSEYEMVSSSCGQGVHVSFKGNRCLSRDNAILYYAPKRSSSKCIHFETALVREPLHKSIFEK